MKRIVTSFCLFIICISLLNLSAFKASAQTLLYSQNFDSSIHPTLPSGWSTTQGGWIVDTSRGSNVSTGYTGVSGLNCMEIANDTFLHGTFELITNNIQATNYINLSVEWGTRNTKHFADSGSAITGFYWSADNGNTWDSIHYARNAGNSVWSLDNDATPIALPAGAEHQATLKFKWVANIALNYQGTYRFDDFNVFGVFSQASGIKQVNAVNKTLGNVFVQNNVINIYSNSAANEKVNVEVYNVLGNVVKSTIMTSSKLILNASGLSSGVYFVKLSTSASSMVNKVVLN